MDDRPASYETYEQISERYAEAVKTKPHNAYLERPMIRALLPADFNGRVLDAGCGPGTNFAWLLERGAQTIVGIDVSPRMIEIAGREAAQNIRLHVADMGKPLDFLEAGSFDLVFSSLAVHYIEDIGALFAEFARVLRPGGWLVFSTHHPQSDFHWHPGNYFETTLVSEDWRGFGDEPVTVSFYRRPLRATTGALAEAGFVIERLTEAQPTDDFRRVDPEGYERARQRPSFMCVRARKETN